MPKNRSGRIVFALIVVALLFVIVRNVYRRTLNNRLIAAVEAKDVAAVRTLLTQGADPNALRPPIEGPGTEKSVLEVAMYASILSPEREEIACLLLQRGAATSQDTRTLNGYLLTACQFGSPNLVRCLLEHGASGRATDAAGRSPLETAIEYRYSVSVPMLPAAQWGVSQRLQVETDTNQRRAASQEIIRLLQEHGARLNLWQAAQMDDVTALRAALDAGTPVEAREPSPLSIIPAGKPSGENQTVTKPTALTQAAQAGSINAVRLLLQRGANVNASDNYYAGPLAAAIRGRQLETARLLLRSGADVKERGNRQTQLHSALLIEACYSLPQLVPDLLQRGVDVKTEGGSVLAAAINSTHAELVPLLLKHGARCRGKSGYAVLRAALEYRPDLIPLFLAQGADARETSKQNSSLIWQAVHSNRPEWIVPLLRAGANVNAHEYPYGSPGGVAFNREPDYTTPLMEAVSRGPQMLRLLLEHGADPNLSAHAGVTPLIVAAQIGNLEGVKMLLAHKADVNGKGETHHTPLYFARRHKHPEVVALLLQAGGKEE